MTEIKIKEDKYETVNNLLKATNYMTAEEHKIVKQIKDNCHNRYEEQRKTGQILLQEVYENADENDI